MLSLMFNRLIVILKRAVEAGPVVATRPHHATEPATIPVLSRLLPPTSMAGRSNSRGFFLYGNLPTEAVRQAVQEALARIRAGESFLAIHPNCGTNLVTTAVFASAAVLLTQAGRRRHLIDRIPTAFLGALTAVILAQPVGISMQQHVTTCADVGDIKVVGVQRRQLGSRVLHWVSLSDDDQLS